MNTTKKGRAPRNKTITLSKDEEVTLSAKLLYTNQLLAVPFENVLNRTVCGELTEVLTHLPKAFADLIIIDPPYNLDKNFNGFHFKASDDAAYVDYLRSWMPAVVELLKPNGSLYLCGDWKSTAALQQVMEENLTVLNRITWQREKGRGASKNWKNGMEDIWFGVKNSRAYFFNVDAVKVKRRVLAPYKQDGKPKDWEETAAGNFRLTYPSNFWDDISIPYWSMPENTDHPTQKPEKLIAKLILASCPEGGVVFDPFLGSGTTSVVAKKLGRRYLGVEMNAEYACWAEKRLEMVDSDARIQGYADGVFWERNSTPAKVKKKSK